MKFLGLALYGEVAKCSFHEAARSNLGANNESTRCAPRPPTLPWRTLLGSRRARALRLAILANRPGDEQLAKRAPISEVRLESAFRNAAFDRAGTAITMTTAPFTVRFTR